MIVKSFFSKIFELHERAVKNRRSLFLPSEILLLISPSCHEAVGRFGHQAVTKLLGGLVTKLSQPGGVGAGGHMGEPVGERLKNKVKKTENVNFHFK